MHSPSPQGVTHTLDTTLDPIDEIQCLVTAKERAVRNEYGNIVTHNFHVGPEVIVIFTLEFQVNPWERCRVVGCASEEMQEANLETLFSSWATERRVLG